MVLCPRCKSELPAEARFCNKCGFNQTNARLAAARAQQRQRQETASSTPSSFSPVPSSSPAKPEKIAINNDAGQKTLVPFAQPIDELEAPDAYKHVPEAQKEPKQPENLTTRATQPRDQKSQIDKNPANKQSKLPVEEIS